MNSCVLLFSGGLDSSVCFFHLLESGVEVTPLFVNYGQVSYQQELESARMILDKANIDFHVSMGLVVINVDMHGSPLIGDKPKWMNEDSIFVDGELVYSPIYVPARNTILALFGLQIAYRDKLDAIAMGVSFMGAASPEGSFPDQSEEWFLATQRIIDFHCLGKDDKYRLITPVGHKRRREIRGMARNYGIRNMVLSCNMPSITGKACGKCSSCLEDVDEDKDLI